MNDMNFDRRPEQNAPVKVMRVFDSCSDKECLTDIEVTLTDTALPPDTNIVRTRSAAVESVCVNVEPIPFNKGFYSIDLAFTFRVEIQCYERACAAPVTVFGTAYASRNCILYGSGSSVRTFTSADGDNSGETSLPDLPIASVSVLEPVVLDTKLTRSCPLIPDTPTARQSEERGVSVTLGLFYVVDLARPVTLMVPTYQYNIPRKDCCTDTDSPCEIFDKLKFPDEEFAPPALMNSCDGLDEIIS